MEKIFLTESISNELALKMNACMKTIKNSEIIIYIKDYHSLILSCLPTLFCILSKEHVMCCAYYYVIITEAVTALKTERIKG